MTATITRDQLREAIEVAIRFAGGGGLSTDEATALRRVADTATQVARGFCTFEGCGCPAVQAGLFVDEPLAVAPHPIESFMIRFDEATSGYTKGAFNTPERNLLTVVG
jgi:hypothetical protein